MTQWRVAPQEQSLCFAEQLRQSQYSHQIHFRCWISSAMRARIQSRIAVRDTPSRSHRNGRPAMGRPTHPGSACGLPASRAGAAAEAACEQADQPDQRDHDGGDEQPMHDETEAEQDDRENRQHNEQQHPLPLLLPEMKGLFSGSGLKTAKCATWLRTYALFSERRV